MSYWEVKLFRDQVKAENKSATATEEAEEAVINLAVHLIAQGYGDAGGTGARLRAAVARLMRCPGYGLDETRTGQIENMFANGTLK